MDTKSLKKQLGAAIAMVLVAAVALGSATYAWFVSNDTVTATSSTISAQSNSAYLVIDTKTTSTASTSSKAYTAANKALYPAAIEKTTDGKASWYSQYAEKTTEKTAKADTKFTIVDKTDAAAEDGTADAAANMDYAIKETFYIGTGSYDGEFTDLKVNGLTITSPAAANELSSAMRVLVVCDDNWQVWSATGELLYSGSAAGEAIASSVSKDNDVQVDVYVYYDGDDANIFSDNLSDLDTDDANSVTVSFSATPVEHGKNA